MLISRSNPANPILLFARFFQFGFELCRVLWIDFSEKGKLHLKVTVVKRINVKKRNQRQQKLRKTRAPRSITKKRGNKRAEHFDRSGRKHFCGFCSTRLNRKCSVLPARNFLPQQIKTVHFLPEAKLSTLETLKHMQAIIAYNYCKHEACVFAKQQRQQQERGSMNIVQSL